MFRITEFDEPITTFDPTLWLVAVESVTAHEDGRLTFHFYCGKDIDG